ncbi:MAG: serine hydroxymethyltransferase [Gammaproteobacteria bacterium]
MPALARRRWVPAACEDYVQSLAEGVNHLGFNDIDARVAELIAENRRVHERDCVNVNPATNVMNPRAEAVLAQGLGSRPSLGYPGDKYEMGLEAIEQIEVIAAELAARVFGARYAEIRVGSGALANLYAFMATTRPGDTIIVPPADIGGHVTHHDAGAAGLYGLNIHPAPVRADGYTLDLDALREQALGLRPKLITVGGSLNLFPHPVSGVRAIADELDAWVLFDAAHLCGMIAGRQWPNPLEQGAHLMTMSTYKSLGGPAGGLLVTSETSLAQAVDGIAYPGLTANFDVAKSAALALTLLDWLEHGAAYAAAMAATANALAQALAERALPVHARDRGFTSSHQFALEAADWGGGQHAARKLRQANILACGIGLPIAPVEGDVNGLRIGTPEIVRWGMDAEAMPVLGSLIARALQSDEPRSLAQETTRFRAAFDTLHFVR